MDFELLKKLKAEFLQSLSDDDETELFGSTRYFADVPVGDFIAWMEKRLADPAEQQYFDVRFDVTGVAGQPLPGAFVSIARSPFPEPEVSKVTDQFGSCTLKLREGDYEFLVSSKGNANEKVSAKIGYNNPTILRVKCAKPA